MRGMHHRPCRTERIPSQMLGVKSDSTFNKEPFCLGLTLVPRSSVVLLRVRSWSPYRLFPNQPARQHRTCSNPGWIYQDARGLSLVAPTRILVQIRVLNLPVPGPPAGSYPGRSGSNCVRQNEGPAFATPTQGRPTLVASCQSWSYQRDLI